MTVLFYTAKQRFVGRIVHKMSLMGHSLFLALHKCPLVGLCGGAFVYYRKELCKIVDIELEICYNYGENEAICLEFTVWIFFAPV